MIENFSKLRKYKIAIMFLAAFIGIVVCFYSVKSEKKLLTVDEAAWIFDSYYLNLYLSGDWDNPQWHALDRYAKHPPFGGYLFGAVMYLIGEPITSPEPAHFWNENDLSKTRNPEYFFGGLFKRFSYNQLMAGRYLSMCFGILTICMTMILAYKLTGFWGAIFGFTLMLINPMFRYVASMATPDMFLMFMSVLATYLSVEIAKRQNIDKESWLLTILLGVMLGVTFATKISGYAVIIIIFIPVFFLSSRNNLSKKILLLIGAIAVGVLMAYLLDPHMHGDPVGSLFSRMVWRFNRIDIQQLASPTLALSNVRDRINHDLFTLFTINIEAFVTFVFFLAGAVTALFGIIEKSKGYVVIVLAIFALAMTLILTPLALIRYVFAYFPFIILLAAAGVEGAAVVVSKFTSCNLKYKMKILGGIIAILVSASVVKYAMPKYLVNAEPAIDDDRWQLVSDYEKSIVEPRVDRYLHERLYEYFQSVGDVKRAMRQMQYLGD